MDIAEAVGVDKDKKPENPMSSILSTAASGAGFIGGYSLARPYFYRNSKNLSQDATHKVKTKDAEEFARVLQQKYDLDEVIEQLEHSMRDYA